MHPQSEIVLKYNPLGKVPILVTEDGFSLFESCAINTFLGDRYRNTNAALVPAAGTNARGIYDQTISVVTTELDAQGLWIHRKHEAMGKYFTFIPDAVVHARKYFHKTNRGLIKQLKGSDGPYLLGADFTAADIAYVHCLEWSLEIGWDDKWKNDGEVVDYFQLCRSRPAYKNVNGMRKEEFAFASQNKKRSKL